MHHDSFIVLWLLPSGEMNYLCLRGTAFSDLPPIDSPLYYKVRCPVLILTVEGDKAHPVKTANGTENSEIESPDI